MHVDECITANELLPSTRLAGVWESIVASDAVKDRLVNQALLALKLRQHLPFTTTALHGLLLLYGPPGTGKTTLARGLAQTLAPLTQDGRARLIEVNPHGLMSGEHGQSQQRVFDLLCEQIPSLADDGLPTVVLLDEVESMAVARSAASLTANPADVHRATDAVLMALDRNATEHPHLLTVATSNFTTALDAAFISRADIAIEVPVPDVTGVLAILGRTLAEFGGKFPELGKLAEDTKLPAIAHALVGLDGRQCRKVITEALAGQRRTVVDPNKLSIGELLTAAQRLRSQESTEAHLAAA